MRAVLLFLLLSWPLAAEPVRLDLGEIRDLAMAPHLDEAAFSARLEGLIGGYAPEPAQPVPGPARNDLFFWSLSARFGTALEGSTVPGGVLTCARYGLDVRARMAERDLSAAAGFAVMQQALILSGDDENWPVGAVARLACALTWDDARRVAPLTRAEVLAALEGFAAVEVQPDPNAGARVRVFGPGGYRIEARGGPVTANMRLDAIWVDQLATHQQLRFRSFLMGGGS
jgi:hypothetical protein